MKAKIREGTERKTQNNNQYGWKPPKKKKKRTDPVIILTAICAVLFVCLIALLCFIAVNRQAIFTGTHEDEGDSVPVSAGAGGDNRIKELEYEKKALESATESMKAEIASLESELESALAGSADNDEASKARERALNEKIAALEAQFSAKQKEIDAVNNKIAAYDSISYLNIGAQAEAVSKLYSTLGGGAPNRVLEKEEAVTDSSGAAVKDASGKTKTQKVEYEQYPHIALYYEDLTTGYNIAYNANDLFFSASLIKAPYVYTVLRTISAFEQKKLDFTPPADDPDAKNPNLDDDGSIIYLEGEEKYDLDRVWTFDKKTMLEDGTGKIKDMADGTQLTYRELIDYSVLYSDNVAFKQLRELFGYSDFYSQASALGVKYANGFMYNTASDYGKFLRAMYDFMESGDKWGEYLKKLMLEANYRILIPYAVSPKQVAHKYGWDIDSYHDMGIVYDEHPYILVVMTDMDTVDDDENIFIRSVVKSVDTIHTNFYKGIDKSLLDRFRAVVEAQETKQ